MLGTNKLLITSHILLTSLAVFCTILAIFEGTLKSKVPGSEFNILNYVFSPNVSKSISTQFSTISTTGSAS